MSDQFGKSTVCGANPGFAREALAGYREAMLGARLLVLGAGAGGGELALTLSQWGFRSAVVVDFDTYEVSNATRTLDFPYEAVRSGRRVYKAGEVARLWRGRVRRAGESPRIRAVVGLAQELSSRVWADTDVVLSCVDHPRARYDVARLARLQGLPCIMGGFDARSRTAQVSYFPRTGGACHACNLETLPDYVEMHTSCGKHGLHELAMGKLPATPNMAKAVGALMAQVLVDGLTTGWSEQAWVHRLHLGSRSRPATVRSDLVPNPECGCRSTRRAVPFRPRSHRLGDVLTAAVRNGAERLELPTTLIVDPGAGGATLRGGAYPAWRFSRATGNDGRADAGDLVPLAAVSDLEVGAHGLGAFDTRAFGWGVGARIDAVGPTGLVQLSWIGTAP